MQVAFMAWLVSTGGCWIFYDHVLYNKEVRYQKAFLLLIDVVKIYHLEYDKLSFYISL